MAEKSWWMLVGGRKRLGRALAEKLAEEHSLIVTSSQPWSGETGWIQEMSSRTQVRTLCWNACDAQFPSQMMADLETLCRDGITLECAILLPGAFPKQPFGQWSVPELRELMDISVIFPLLAAQGLSRIMAEGGIIQFLLDTAIHRPMINHLPYSVAKSGLAAAVPGLARLLAPKIRVVGHALGVVLPDEQSNPDQLAAMNLLKRNGNPGDLLRAVRYAAESPYLTGEILTLDGGRRWA